MKAALADPDGDNIVIFNKNLLHDPVHHSDYLYAFDPDKPSELMIMDYLSGETVLNVRGI